MKEAMVERLVEAVKGIAGEVNSSQEEQRSGAGCS